MKNIHLLKTSKPSKILKDLVDKTYQFKKDATFGNRIELPLNIYITSDEEIKEGDWFISLYSNSIQRELILDWTLNKDAYKKIILTTNQDLIKDGIQAIDDEFLEWFIKNPTCEEVEVEHYNNQCSGECVICDNTCGDWHKIVIPKEELDYTALLQPVGTKQETLEEVAKELHPVSPQKRKIWLQGAKWQQQQYEILFDEYHEYTVDCIEVELKRPLPFKNWFKQFKNK